MAAPEAVEAEVSAGDRPLALVDRFVEALRRVDPPWFAIAWLVTLWTAVFGVLAYRRHDRFSSFTLDMAIFDQATWLISRADGLFMSVRGLEFFGHHANLGLFLLAPFYWLGAGAHFLNFFQVVSVALGAVAVFLLARDRLESAWLGVPLAAAYLLHPSLGFMAWELFHPETVAIPALLFAWWFATRERWAWFAVCLAYAVSWKEDVALAAVIIGLLLLLRRHWRVGLTTAGVALVYFMLFNRVIIPANSGAEETFYNNLFGELGDTPTEVARTAIVNPTEITRRLTASDSKSYMWQMTASYGFVPLAAPHVLGIGVPQAVINLISSAGFTREIYYHYAALPLAGLTLATVEGVGWLGRRRREWRHFLVGFVAACSLAAAMAWGLSPIGREYRSGWWPHGPDARRETKEAALAMVPGDAAVSATYQFVPHLAHRKVAYDWPNPWISNNWGVNGENLPDPRGVEWLVIDRHLTGGDNVALLERLVDGGEFRVIFDRQDVVVARRVRDEPRPGRASQPPP